MPFQKLQTMKTSEKITIASMLLGPGVAYSFFYLYHAILVVKIGWALLSLLSQKKYKLPVIKQTGPIYLFIVLTALSLLYSHSPAAGLIYGFYLIIGLTIVTQIVSFCPSAYSLRNVYKLMSVVAIIITLIGLAELLTAFRWPFSEYSSFAPYFGREPKDLSHFSDLQIILVSAMPASVYLNPNNFSVFLVIVLPFAFFMHKSSFSRIFIALICVLILSTGSRSCVIAIFVLILIILLFYRLKFVLFAPVIFLFILFLPTLLSDISILKTGIERTSQIFTALTRYITLDISSSDSVSTRGGYITYGLMALKDVYYLGLGAGNSGFILELSNQGVGQISVHNFLMEIFIDYGFLGIILFLISYVYCMISTYRGSKRNLDPFLKNFNSAVFTSLGAFIPATIALSSAIYYFPMWILLGLAIATMRLNKKETNGVKSG